MSSTNSEITELAQHPSIVIPYLNAEREFGGQVAAIMDKLYKSKASQAKAMKPNEFTWRLVYKQADDPPEHVTDNKEFASILAANSKAWLKITGGKWVTYEPIHTTPSKIMQIYENRARAVCSQRLQDRNSSQPEEEWDVGTEESLDLLDHLDQWLSNEPEHDKRVAFLARAALKQLIASVEE